MECSMSCMLLTSNQTYEGTISRPCGLLHGSVRAMQKDEYVEAQNRGREMKYTCLKYQGPSLI